MDIAAKKQALLARRAELVSNLSDIEHQLDAPATKDWEDRASERQGDEVLEALGHAEHNEMIRIDAALERIEEGEYGYCAKCGTEIAEARLDLLPDTPLCKDCAV